MLTESELARIDQQNVYKIYEKWPEHFRKAAEYGLEPKRELDAYSSIAFCGMGGSGTAGDVIHDFLQQTSFVPSTVVRGQAIPKFIGKGSLAIVSSVSGNTGETLAMARECKEREVETICISSGGKLEEFAKENKTSHVRIPSLGLPRASLPYLVMPCLNLFKKSFRTNIDFQSIFSDLEKMHKNILLPVKESKNPAKTISSFFSTGFAICLSSPYLVSAATRFKDSLNENAKVHCLRESVLEASHNEVVPFTYPLQTNPRVLLLTWKNDLPLVKERLAKMRSLFRKISQPFTEITAIENDIINAILSSIYLLDFSTIYMAVSRGVDPSPTPAIDILKKL